MVIMPTMNEEGVDGGERMRGRLRLSLRWRLVGGHFDRIHDIWMTDDGRWTIDDEMMLCYILNSDRK